MSEVVYFDNAATTFPKPEEVYSFMDHYYRNFGVNVGRGQYKLAAEASKLVEDTRDQLQELFHCPKRKVVFTHTATESLNIILQGMSYVDGCNIYLSPFEHNAVTRVVNHLQCKYNINVFQLSVNQETFSYDLERIKYQFDENPPGLVVVSHASNVCGVLAPIDKICSLSKKYNSTNVIDMSQTAGLIDTDLSNLDIDYAVFAGHKTLYGPLGIAGFFCNADIKLKPLIYGGTGIDSANQELPETVPERYEVASQNILAIAGLHAALKWIKSIGIENVYQRERENYKRLVAILSQFDNIHLIGPLDIEQTIGVVSCIFDSYSSDSIGKILSDNNIAVRTGLHCSPYAHSFLGTFPAGTVRFSISYFTSEIDFISLKEVLETIEENS